MEEVNIYTLELHEEVLLKTGTWVLRVPGGWIYTRNSGDEGSWSDTFVPFSNEFLVVKRTGHPSEDM